MPFGLIPMITGIIGLSNDSTQLFCTQVIYKLTNKIYNHNFPFSMMKKDSPSLYSQLSEANILIFKGDLNYRKLVGDLSWSTETTFLESLQGFNPAPLVALRTLKADVCVGLEDGQAETTATIDENFMVNGKTLYFF